MENEISREELAALYVLRSTGVPIIEAALIAREAINAGHGRTGQARRCIAAGADELRRQKKTVTFGKAVRAALEARRHRRERTQRDFRYFTQRFLKRCKGLEKRRVRSITPQECSGYIEKAFDTPRQRYKARLILSGVFSTAVKKGWCSSNPVTQVDTPHVEENRVPILMPGEIDTLMIAARSYRQGVCLAAVGMMLYAGIRPHEVSRLVWRHVDMEQQAIYISPQHSKTGGARRVTVHKPLLRILRECEGAADAPVCPAGWLKHWRELRRQAGWGKTHPWPQDTLRHTFASYHLQCFRSFEVLQCELGHRDAALLRTRYLDMRGVVNAPAFWEVKKQIPLVETRGSM